MDRQMYRQMHNRCVVHANINAHTRKIGAQTCGRFTATGAGAAWVALVGFMQWIPSLLIYSWCQLKLNLYSGKEPHRKTKKKSFVLFCFLLKSCWKSARFETSESMSILLAHLFQHCYGDIFDWWVSFAFLSGMHRCIDRWIEKWTDIRWTDTWMDRLVADG